MKINWQQRRWAVLLFVVLMFGSMYLYPLPYFISKPGDALELAPRVSVEGGYTEQGTFMLTTVRMSGANLFNYAWATWRPYIEVIPKKVLLAEEETEEEYTERQLRGMQNSQDSAIIVAYQLANKKVDFKFEGVQVESIRAGMPAVGKLQVGDIITHVDDYFMKSHEELIKFLQTKKIGESVHLSVVRNGQEIKEVLTLAALPLSEEEKEQEVAPKSGLGVSISTKRILLAVDPPVEINTERIGGPSAGLMLSLEIYNQLTEVDLTKGYRIAGTGTINAEGEVGRIGGVHQKVVAADKAQAEIFFAPTDGSNYQVALETAENIATSMKIVPVNTINDALKYLDSLPLK